jgi:hypothetical protein
MEVALCVHIHNGDEAVQEWLLDADKEYLPDCN